MYNMRATGSWCVAVLGLCGVVASCDSEAGVGSSIESIRGGSPLDVNVRADGTLDPSSRVQWARDAVVFVQREDTRFCTATLVSPRVVLTAAHCVRSTPVSLVRFGPRNSAGTYGEITPGSECSPIDTSPDPSSPFPPCVDAEVLRCEVHPDRDGACGDGFFLPDPAPAQLNDIAVLLLGERFDSSDDSRYRVTPAEVVANNPNNVFGVPDPQAWLHATVRFAGFGRRGMLDTNFHNMRLYAESTVFSVNSIEGEFWAHEFGEVPASVAFAGDSGGGVFVGASDDGSPLQMLGVFHAGNGSSNFVAHLTAPNHQEFIEDYLGPNEEDYPGEMLRINSAIEVWTGPSDLPRPGEPGYVGWRDEETGQTARDVDPDGDGLRGRHDLCWGHFNPRQQTADAAFTDTCYSASTDEYIEYGCAPRPAAFEGLGVEGSNDNDRDGVANACDNCPDVANGDQNDCDSDSEPGVRGGDACSPDDDGDGVPNGCDNCAEFNPSQRDCDGDELGDECESDDDRDGRPDDCDNCPADPNYDQANCNFDAIVQWNVEAPSRGLPLREQLGDACDSDPCGETGLLERHERRGPTVEVSFDRVEVDALAARATPLRALNGFRFCACDLDVLDEPAARALCRDAVGCTLTDQVTYDRIDETAPWAWMSVAGPGLGAGAPRTELELTHARPSGTFAADLVATWNLYEAPPGATYTSDALRYATLFPPPPGGSPPTSYTGVVWTHTPGTSAARFDPLVRERTSHYWSGSVPRPFTSFDTPRPDCFEGSMPFAGAFDWHGRIPFIGRNCGVPELPIGFRIADLFLPPLPGTDIPDLDLLGQPADWVPVSEPAGLLPPNGLRYVALDLFGGLIGAVEQRGAAFVPRGQQCPNCPPCPNCDPIAPLAMARGLAPEGELETIPVLSALRDSLWLIESGGDSVPRVLTRRLGEARAREPRDIPGLGRVLAAVYSPREDVIWLVDERSTGGRRPTRTARLVGLQPDTGRMAIVGSWRRLTANDRFAMALDPTGALYVVGGIGRSRAHAVVRLDPSLSRREVRVLGARVGVGAPVPGMARANSSQLAVLVEGPGPRSQRVVELAASSFRSGGVESCF